MATTDSELASASTSTMTVPNITPTLRVIDTNAIADTTGDGDKDIPVQDHETMSWSDAIAALEQDLNAMEDPSDEIVDPAINRDDATAQVDPSISQYEHTVPCHSNDTIKEISYALTTFSLTAPLLPLIVLTPPQDGGQSHYAIPCIVTTFKCFAKEHHEEIQNLTRAIIVTAYCQNHILRTLDDRYPGNDLLSNPFFSPTKLLDIMLIERDKMRNIYIILRKAVEGLKSQRWKGLTDMVEMMQKLCQLMNHTEVFYEVKDMTMAQVVGGLEKIGEDVMGIGIAEAEFGVEGDEVLRDLVENWDEGFELHGEDWLTEEHGQTEADYDGEQEDLDDETEDEEQEQAVVRPRLGFFNTVDAVEDEVGSDDGEESEDQWVWDPPLEYAEL